MKTKRCSVCGEEKPLTEFAFRNKTKGTYRANCRKCQSNYSSKRYYFNKEILDKTKEGKCCERCGYDKNINALCFHHIDPTTKSFEISNYTYFTLRPMAEYYKEVDKCELLCLNCHAEEHDK